jgi:hypothetical protein
LPKKKIPEKQGKNTGKHAHSHTVGAGAHEHKERLRRWCRGRGWGTQKKAAKERGLRRSWRAQRWRDKQGTQRDRPV